MLMQRLFNKETIGQSAGIVLFFIVLQRIIQTVSGIVFARLLGPAEYGVYTLAFFFIPLFVSIARLGIPSCFNRYIPQYEQKGALRSFLKKTYLLIIAGGVFTVLACLLNAKALSIMIFGSSIYQKLVIICALTVFPYVIYEALVYSFSGMRVFKLAGALKTSELFVLGLLGSILLIFSPKAESIIFADLIAFTLVVIFFGLVFRKYLGNLDSQDIKIKESNFYGKIFKFSVFFIIAPVINTLFNNTDRWMLSRFTDFSQVGIYSMGLNIAGIIFLFGMIAGNVLSPNMSHIWEQGDKQKVMYVLNFSLKVNTLFILCGALAISLFKRQIVSILYGVEYIGCLPIIGAMLIFWLYHGVYWTVSSYSELIEKTYIPLICGCAGLICNVFFNYLWIPRYGLMGAAVATNISFGISIIMMYLWFMKEGFKIKPSAFFVCLLPLLFMFDNLVIAVLFAILLVVILRTNFILSGEEKDNLVQLLRKSLSKVKINNNSKNKYYD